MEGDRLAAISNGRCGPGKASVGLFRGKSALEKRRHTPSFLFGCEDRPLNHQVVSIP